MSRFRPARASPPLRPSLRNPALAAAAAEEILNNSRSSVCSAPELVALSPEEIDFIDTVIQKAGDAATTFLTIFKAYNDTLQERGIDPQNEVVYYGKLLKLGTMKGKNWAQKWETVKQQQVPTIAVHRKDPPPRPAPPSPAPSRAKILSRLTGALKAFEKDDDAFTLHSHQDETESAARESADDLDATPVPRNRVRPIHILRPTSPTLTDATTSLGLDVDPRSSGLSTRIGTPAYKLKGLSLPRVPKEWDAETSEATVETAQASSSVPPSYGAATREIDATKKSSYTPLRALARAHTRATPTANQAPPASHPVPAAARSVVIQARERAGSVLNEDDAWKKIRMARDDEEADRFRVERLQERCWEVWKQGYHWILTTNGQIAQARDNLVVRVALHKWRIKTAERRELHQRVAKISDCRRLRAALEAWRAKLKERRQAQWREDMRARMKTVRDHHELKLKKDAWAKWRQSYRSHLSEQHYSEKLVLRIYMKWRKKLVHLDRLEGAGERLVKSRERKQIEKCWDLWKRAMEVRKAEKAMSERVGLRILANAVDTWKSRLLTHQFVDDHYDRLVLKHVLRRWQSAQGRTKTLEVRAEKYRARQDDVLVRAVWRVWKAHERGKLLGRVKSARLLKQQWSQWMKRLEQQKKLADIAVTFSLRPSSTLAQGAIRRWHETHVTHRDTQAFAAQYHAVQLQFKMMLIWRIQLRAKLKLVKHAKLAEKYFAMRNAWKRWQEKIAEKRRERKVKVFEARILRTFLHDWLQRTQAQRQMKLSADVITARVNLRIMTTALTHWTNRVADLKFRELEVSSHYEKAITTIAFNKWKSICIRHVEELSLMASYQDVKREENMRKMFNRWLAAARKAGHRRLLLQQREEELRLAVIASAWDKWRERYLDIRLQPQADVFLIQGHKNLVFRAFGIWHSKTNSLPAVRFHASHLKARFWKTWRDAMPKVLQAKEARDMERRSVLTKAFEKWMQAYKTKIELKAVARARYLRLPTAAPRQSGPSPRSIAASNSAVAPGPSSARALVRPCSPLSDATGPSSARPTATAGPVLYKGRLGIASLLSGRSRSPERPKLSTVTDVTRPRASRLSTRASTVAREPSPTRSVVSTHGYVKRRMRAELPLRVTAPSSTAGDSEVGRSRLWKELQGLQLRSRPPTEGSLAYTREPP